MFHILIDTSVWLDLAEDQKQTPSLAVAEYLVQDGLMQLIVPSIFISEFRKNRDRADAAIAARQRD